METYLDDERGGTTMKLCDDSHEEICYDYGDCPLCKALEELDYTIYQKIELQDKIDDLERELNNLSG